MTIILFRQLIDAAIGSPDPGHVDFYALQCVLYHFADKLNILDSVVDNTKFRSLFSIKKKNSRRPSKIHMTSTPSRLLAGSDDFNAQAATAQEDQTATSEQIIEIEANVDENVEAVEETEEIVEVEVEVEVTPQTSTAEIVLETAATPMQSARASEASSKGKVEFVEPTATINIANEAKETRVEKPQVMYEPISEDLLMGISIMKDQIELAMEQINMLANMEVVGKSKSLMSTLKDLNKKMRLIQRANFYIESNSQVLEQDYIFDKILEDVTEGIEELEETEVEYAKVEPEAQFSMLPPPSAKLEYHLCYTPERIMDELLELKSEFCNVTNKLSDLMVALDEIDSQRTKVILAELQEHMREVRHIAAVLKDGQEFMNSKQKVSIENILDLEKGMNLLRMQKVDKADMELALSAKVEYELLERKVSHDQLKEVVCRIEKQFCKMQRLISFNEKHAMQVIENMRKNLGLDNIDEMLKAFRNKVDQDIEKLQKILQNYLDSTNDECAAAGARVQVLQDLACISCDTQCVMRRMEKSKVGKLRDAHVTAGLGPLITYELGSIRKSGLMGYFRKDEFPHAPNAWMNKQKMALKMCLPRHAGGEHTKHTAKELVDKIVKRTK